MLGEHETHQRQEWGTSLPRAGRVPSPCDSRGSRQEAGGATQAWVGPRAQWPVSSGAGPCGQDRGLEDYDLGGLQVIPTSSISLIQRSIPSKDQRLVMSYTSRMPCGGKRITTRVLWPGLQQRARVWGSRHQAPHRDTQHTGHMHAAPVSPRECRPYLCTPGVGSEDGAEPALARRVPETQEGRVARAAVRRGQASLAHRHSAPSAARPQNPHSSSPELQLDPPAVQQDGGGLVVDPCKQAGQKVTPALCPPGLSLSHRAGPGTSSFPEGPWRSVWGPAPAQRSASMCLLSQGPRCTCEGFRTAPPAGSLEPRFPLEVPLSGFLCV